MTWDFRELSYDVKNMIYLTEKAANYVKEISDGEGIGHYIIRMKVIGFGCSGTGQDLSFDDQINELDETFELDGVKLVIDPLSFQYLDEATVDYVESPIGAGFKITSPNFKKSCGCGKSFAV